MVVIGTGDTSYDKAFSADEDIPFLVLVDDDGEAARAASVRKVNFLTLMGPRSWAGTRRAWREGYRIHKSGKRVTQLGATFVIGPGEWLRYTHVDAHTADHAPLADVLGALR